MACFPTKLSYWEALADVGQGPWARAKFPAIDIDGNTSSPKTLDMAYSWYAECLGTHKSCNNLPTLKPGWLPTRLVDIGLPGDTQWKVMVTSEDITSSPPPPYMTLSYRWGLKPQRLTLSSTNETELRRGRPIDQLPRTFRDMIVVAHRFRIRYVWIDCLCIIQDSADDWKTEAPTMKDVYMNSACNVAAAASDDPDGGLFRERDTSSVAPGLVDIQFASKALDRYFVFDNEYERRYIHAGALRTRGWVFQERFLAPRVLSFTESQVAWECYRESKCEGFPHGRHSETRTKNIDNLLSTLEGDASPSKSGRMGEKTLQSWAGLVGEYSSCQLTRPGDRLYAFAGVANFFQDFTGDTYLAGIWRDRALQQLCWRVVEPAPRPTKTKYRAPSWSWASVDVPVYMRDIRDKDTLLVDLVDVGVTPDRDGGMGDVVDGFVKVRGAVMAARYKPSPERIGHFEITPRHGAVKPFTARLHMDAAEIKYSQHGEFTMLPFVVRGSSANDSSRDSPYWSMDSLIVAPVGDSESVYRRVGVAMGKIYEKVGLRYVKIQQAERAELVII
ncbi:hypothetical protein EsH8_IV_000228 [Colletotrichum jinshuiense]